MILSARICTQKGEKEYEIREENCFFDDSFSDDCYNYIWDKYF